MPTAETNSKATTGFLQSSLQRCNNYMSESYDILEALERCNDRLYNTPKELSKALPKSDEPSDFLSSMNRFEERLATFNERLNNLRVRLSEAI